MTDLVNPVSFAGFLLVAVPGTVLFSEVLLRWFNRAGLSQGAVGRRRGETAAQHQRRNLEYDAREIRWLAQHRMLMFALVALGVALLVLGVTV